MEFIDTVHLNKKKMTEKIKNRGHYFLNKKTGDIFLIH